MRIYLTGESGRFSNRLLIVLASFFYQRFVFRSFVVLPFRSIGLPIRLSVGRIENPDAHDARGRGKCVNSVS